MPLVELSYQTGRQSGQQSGGQSGQQSFVSYRTGAAVARACCPRPEKLSQLGLACGQGGVSEVQPGLVHGPHPSSDLLLQRLRILDVVHVFADAGDHAAADEKNVWAPLIQHQHIVVEHGFQQLLKTVTRNKTVIQTSHR